MPNQLGLSGKLNEEEKARRQRVYDQQIKAGVHPETARRVALSKTGGFKGDDRKKKRTTAAKKADDKKK